ncbi:hypothetical protein H0H81_002148 [Sphagnurus paluster]|uniref:Peptidase A1 domain-containing protein n=1 Tax=Sphagnurus paluster TaxID=117069 RepID=A0A9P7FNQ5_9AGAR|nr:hypothetical protein H0H81_002148 [Sphagnurus paluster]
MLLSSALLTTGLVVLGLTDDVHAHPAHAPFLSIPLSRLGPRPETHPLPPTIVHQQHVNRAIRRHELMTGATTTPDHVLIENLRRRAAALPPHLQKRFNHPGLEALFRHPQAGERDESQNSSSASYKAEGSTREGLTPATKPTFKHTLGLDIQGQDIGYVATLQIGTPPRDFRLLMDSGSADLWVGAEGCKSQDPFDDQEGCGKHTFLGPQSSSTFNDTKKPWKIQYGTGAVSGTLVKDTLVIAGLKLPNYRFGVARVESGEFTPDYIPFDGLAGLAKATISQQGTVPLVEALYAAKCIPAPVVSYHIPRFRDGYNKGELTLGGLNPDKYDPNTLVRLRNISPFGFWEAHVDAVKVGGKDLGWSTRTALFDTGTTLLIAPPADVSAIHAHIPGAYQDPDGLGGWTVPCVPKKSKSPVMTLTLGGRSFAVDARDIAFLPVDEANPQGNCTSGITAGTPGGPQQWLVGDVFLKSVYMSTDIASDTITFAKLKKRAK